MDDGNTVRAAAAPWLIWLTTGGVPIFIQAAKAFAATAASVAKVLKPKSPNGPPLTNSGTGGVTSGNSSPVITGNGNTIVASPAVSAARSSGSDGAPAVIQPINSGSGTQIIGTNISVNLNVNINAPAERVSAKIPRTKGRPAAQRRTRSVRGGRAKKNRAPGKPHHKT